MEKICIRGVCSAILQKPRVPTYPCFQEQNFVADYVVLVDPKHVQ